MPTVTSGEGTSVLSNQEIATFEEFIHGFRLVVEPSKGYVSKNIDLLALLDRTKRLDNTSRKPIGTHVALRNFVLNYNVSPNQNLSNQTNKWPELLGTIDGISEDGKTVFEYTFKPFKGKPYTVEPGDLYGLEGIMFFSSNNKTFSLNPDILESVNFAIPNKSYNQEVRERKDAIKKLLQASVVEVLYNTYDFRSIISQASIIFPNHDINAIKDYVQSRLDGIEVRQFSSLPKLGDSRLMSGDVILFIHPEYSSEFRFPMYQFIKMSDVTGNIASRAIFKKGKFDFDIKVDKVVFKVPVNGNSLLIFPDTLSNAYRITTEEYIDTVREVAKKQASAKDKLKEVLYRVLGTSVTELQREIAE